MNIYEMVEACKPEIEAYDTARKIMEEAHLALRIKMGEVMNRPAPSIKYGEHKWGSYA